MHPRRSLIASLLLVCAIVALRDEAAACIAARGDRVVLASDSMDPDVFVWDSMVRLALYTSGNYVTNDVLRHTLLVSAGTEAVVITCRDRVLHPKFMEDVADAVGLKISTGRYRGRYGWVVSADLRVTPPAAGKRKP